MIGKAVRFWRLNLPMVLKLLLPPSLVMMVCLIILQCFFNQVSRLSLSNPLAIGLAVASFFSIFALIWSGCVLTARQMAFVRWFCGFSPDLLSAVKQMKGKMLPMIGIVTMFFLLAAGGVLLSGAGVALSTYLFSLGVAGSAAGVLAMILSIAVALCLLSLIMVWFWMSLSVLACEDAGLGNIVGRAFELCARNLWRSLAFGSIAFVFINVLDTGFAVPLVALQGIDYAVRTSMGNYSPVTPLWVLVIMQMWAAMKDMFLRPLVQFAFGMLYFDLCCRRDGLDLRRRLLEMRGR